MPEFCEAKSHLRGTNNREENAPAAIFSDRAMGANLPWLYRTARQPLKQSGWGVALQISYSSVKTNPLS